MDSPLLQYAREENQRVSQLHAQTQAEAIGVELANREMAFRREVKDKEQKLSTLGTLFNSYKGPARIDAMKQIGALLGIKMDEGINEESRQFKNMEDFIRAVQDKNATPDSVNKAFEYLTASNSFALPKSMVTVDLGPEGGGKVRVEASDAVDLAKTKYTADAAGRAANLKLMSELNKEQEEKEFEGAKVAWNQLMDKYKSFYTGNSQLIGDPEAFFKAVEDKDIVVDAMLKKMREKYPADLAQYNRIQSIMDRRLKVQQSLPSPKSARTFYQELGIE